MKWRMILAVIYATFALRKESLKKKVKGSNPVQAWIFYYFIFVLFLYFFYHSFCRKDQFTVLILKFSDL